MKRLARLLVLGAGFVAMVATSPRPYDWSTNTPEIGHGSLQLDPYHHKGQALVGLQVRPSRGDKQAGARATSCTLMLRARLRWQVPGRAPSPDLPPSIVRLRIGPYLPNPTTAREQASWVETQQLVEAIRPGAEVEPSVEVLWNLLYGCPVGKPCQETLVIEAEWLHATHGNLVVEWELDTQLSGSGKKASHPFEIVEVPPKPAPPRPALSAPNPESAPPNAAATRPSIPEPS